MNDSRHLHVIRRKRARAAIYLELLFVAIPFIAMSIIFYSKGDIKDIFHSPEWSLAATVLSGQTVVRFTSGLMKHNDNKNWQVAQIYTGSIILFLIVPSLIIFTIAQLNGQLPNLLALLQIVIFFLSIIVFILLGSIGQILLDG